MEPTDYEKKIKDRKHFRKQSIPLDQFNALMDRAPMEEVEDELEELSPTSSCHTSHQNNPGLRPNNADFSYHAKPYIPNSIIPVRET